MWKKILLLNDVAFIVIATMLPFQFQKYSMACGTGCEEHQGTCACDAKPIGLALSEEVQPSNEKPRRSQQPDWQTGTVTAAMPPSEASKDAKLDAERASADNEGKKAAGLN